MFIEGFFWRGGGGAVGKGELTVNFVIFAFQEQPKSE